ncbi:hypothetical protein DYB37_005097 [Aphanomyces astaci]|uniref:Uncharacterized protein n=1 Tax=Aphanomyces astaci TaxID=112090 RepID=A0A397DXV4_APHAT|nr:hypothetical protein AaE_012839 [Aphanomyces astaci]RHY16832.1 hypothetical protein DYB25_004177 [Aphanomyces astaci]RHY41094.1 hypothetical protein DYB34_000916 [Aphanomyces astaci]RHY42333.1 hypothetical protein DYB38_001802 [Aphanomyces astaci]RHY73073.1 hypothetical protein DYB30_002410 [Aphanomyces astaci]
MLVVSGPVQLSTSSNTLQHTPAIMREKRRLPDANTAASPSPIKRTRSFTDYEYEEMLATVLTMTEDLYLLLDVVADICHDQRCRRCTTIDVITLQRKLVAIENTVMDVDDAKAAAYSLRAVQAMCVDMFAVLKFIMGGAHYADIVALNLSHLVLGSRNQFAQFMMQYSLN